MIFVTSDLHFCHNKEFIFKARGFNTIEEHNTAIIQNWNKTVSDDDTVYVLGDIMLMDNVAGRKCWNQLRGHKIIILGNHDSSVRAEMYKDFPNTEVAGYSTIVRIGGWNWYLSHFPTITGNWGDNERPASKRLWNLCGHSHCTDPFADWDKGLIYHVEMDAHNCTPISIDEIKQQILAKI